MNTLHIVVQDCESILERVGISRPYGLWNVADQPMLYHWLDLAHESDYEKVVVHCREPERLKNTYFDRGHFWPLECEFDTDDSAVLCDIDEYSVVSVDSLISSGAALESPDLWDLIDHHWKLVKERLELLWDRYRDLAPGLPVGQKSRVHPTARLIEPYWIGDNCEIGEGCTVGPLACLGNGTRLEKGATISNSHIGPGNVVGQDIELSAHFLEEGILFNRDERVWHKGIDSMIVSPMGFGAF